MSYDEKKGTKRSAWLSLHTTGECVFSVGHSAS